MNLAKKSLEDQEQAYSPSKRTSFDNFCDKHVIYLEGVLSNKISNLFYL